MRVPRILMLTAALAAATGAPPAAAQTSPSPSSSPAPTVVLTGAIMGDGRQASWTVDAPAGWRMADGAFVVPGEDRLAGVSAWHVGTVPSDPCHWSTTQVPAGGTVDEVVRALLAQEVRAPSEPAPVTVGGHEGLFIAWSVPADLVVTGDGDFEGCDEQGSHRDYVSWFGAGTGERYQQMAGQVDRLWILDVDGEVIVVDATHGPDATPEQIAELEAIVATVRFPDA